MFLAQGALRMDQWEPASAWRQQFWALIDVHVLPHIPFTQRVLKKWSLDSISLLSCVNLLSISMLSGTYFWTRFFLTLEGRKWWREEIYLTYMSVFRSWLCGQHWKRRSLSLVQRYRNIEGTTLSCSVGWQKNLCHHSALLVTCGQDITVRSFIFMRVRDCIAKTCVSYHRMAHYLFC